MVVLELPIDPDSRSLGVIQYKSNVLRNLKGVISTSFYLRPDTSKKEKDPEYTKPAIYRTGLLHYLKLTESPKFRGWKMILYTDAFSLNRPIDPMEGGEEEHHKFLWNQIINHPNIIIATIRWSEYANGKPGRMHIDDSVVRVMRSIAYWHFPMIPVLVRDADTLYENVIKRLDMTPQMVEWEYTLLEHLKRKKKRFLIATQPHYWRPWHVFPGTKVRIIGCYAGLTSSLGNVEEWSSGDLWRQCLEFIRKYSYRKKEGGSFVTSDVSEGTYIGKDEQLLGIVILPALLEKAQLYYLEFIQVEGQEVKDKELKEHGFLRYPSPYLDSIGRGGETLQEPLKDTNELTELITLNPRIIPLAMTDETDEIMRILIRRNLKKLNELLRKRPSLTRKRKRDRKN